MVVLNEISHDACGFLEGPAIETFEEEPAFVTEHLGLKTMTSAIDVRSSFHQNTLSVINAFALP